MYEYEDAVRRCVVANPTVNFIYTVECDYDDGEYDSIGGFPIPGASGNPFCIFPAPAALQLSLIGGGTAVTLGDLVKYLPKPPSDLGPAAVYTSLRVFNGGYKLYGGAKHIANSCWAVISDPHSVSVQQAAAQYAKHIGHLP
jgi:hypothetical protein